MPPRAHPSETESDAQCVLLVGGGAVPSNLVAALGQRGINVAIARAEPEVMAELAGGGVTSVVVVEPDRQNRARELHAAADIYHPEVRFWSYTPQAPGQEATLSVFAAEAAETYENSGSNPNPWYPRTYGEQEAASTVKTEPDSKTGPQLDTDPVIAGPYDRPGPNRPPEDAPDEHALVTEQELAMLLGTDSTPPPGTVAGQVAGSIRGHGRQNGQENGRE